MLPGVGPALTIALLLPLTYQVDASYAFMLFAGIYYGAMYGGSTTAILLNTPGETASLVTALDGHAMARRGRAGAALMTAAIGSFVAGTFGTIALTFLAGPVVGFALAFGPAEYFALMVLAFVTVSATLTSSVQRGLVSLTFGVVLGMVGIDLQTGQPRFTFGVSELLGGIDVVIVAVGLFAVGETFHLAAGSGGAGEATVTAPGPLRMTADEWRRSWKAWLRGACIGFPLGAIPAGARSSRRFSPIGPSGGCRSTRRSSVTAPSRGSPAPKQPTTPRPRACWSTPRARASHIGDGGHHALRVPELRHPARTDAAHRTARSGWGLIASLYIANVMLLVLNLPLVGLWVRILAIRSRSCRPAYSRSRPSARGASAAPSSTSALLYGIGFVGFVMRRFDFPAAPVIIGMILGPLAEQEFRRAMTISHGDPAIFLERPLALTLLCSPAGARRPGVLSMLRARTADRRHPARNQRPRVARPLARTWCGGLRPRLCAPLART